MTGSRITPEMLSAFQALNEVGRSGEKVHIVIEGQGMRQEFDASPELVRGFTAAAGAEVLGGIDRLDESVRLDSERLSDYGLSEQDVGGLQSHTDEGRTWFKGSDILPVLAQRQGEQDRSTA